MRKLILVIILLSTGYRHADDYDQQYGQAINLLYQQNKPAEALSIFQQLDSAEPNRSWATAFMCGYVLRVYLKNPAEALPYLVRAQKLVKGENEDPYKNFIQAHEDLKQYAAALRGNESSQRELKQWGKVPSPWFAENRAWLLMQMGRFDEALRTAPAGSWVATQLAPRDIRIEWRLQLAHLLQQWGLAAEQTIRLSLPLERSYQKTISREFEMDESIRHAVRARDGLNYLELSRDAEQSWPSQVTLRLVIRHEPARGNRNMRLAQVAPGSKLYPFASDNGGGIFSLDNPEFIALVERVTADGKSPADKARLALNYLRANFRYGEKPNLARWNAHDALKFGSGDCGYYSYISIAMLRALKIPVRGIYGLNEWRDPAPALPHAIIEIYDAGSRQWLPHDPQSELHFGFIISNYVPLFAPNPSQSNSHRAPDGIVELDTTYFFWSGSGADTLAYTITPLNAPTMASRSVPAGPAFAPTVVKPGVSTGPLPR